jgi:hypothetical protein
MKPSATFFSLMLVASVVTAQSKTIGLQSSERGITRMKAEHQVFSAFRADSVTYDDAGIEARDDSYNCWLDLGFGIGGWRTGIAAVTNLNISIQNGKNLYTFRYNRAFDEHLFDIAGKMSDYGIMYGLIEKNKYSFVSLSAGLGITVEKSVRMGIPLEADLYATPIPWVGVGIKLCGGVSPGPGPTRNYWCLALGLQFGKLR